jgi:hypothetical protein
VEVTWNRSTSSASVPAVSVYPDSDKIAVWPGDEANELIFRRGRAVPPWSDGEDGWHEATPASS